MKKTEYEELRDVWYKKLADSGFTDIELKGSWNKVQSKDKNHASEVYRTSKFEYSVMATHFLNEYKFKSNLEEIIWEYHSNGISIEKIKETLNKVNIKTNNKAIWLIISELRKKMFKKYKVGTK